MAIPIYLQQFKAAGVYRVVFDKSTMLNQDTSIMRLVVGYSEKGPFNIPVLVRTAAEFIQRFGGINKKLERRGIYFHRLALQMLNKAPIICLNLKKFDGETVQGASISTKFNPNYNAIDTVTLNVEDIYDTTRFWELKAETLNELKDVNGYDLSTNYINIAVTDTIKASTTIFIRKANGSKVAGYNITVNDWYADKQDEMPDWLEDYKNNYISDFFAEIYLFRDKFNPQQVLASETLKNYFIYDASSKDKNLKLAPYVIDAYGDPVDTLDALYIDEASNAIGHYVGCLIPYFVNKQGRYASLDIAFNQDYDVHSMMMSFNVDLLDDGINIDLSGKSIINSDIIKAVYNEDGGVEKNKYTKLLSNADAPIVADTISFGTNVVKYTKPEESSDTTTGNESSDDTTHVETYSFTSWSAAEEGEGIQYGSGTVEVLSRDDTSATVRVLTNEATDNTPADQAAAFVGKEFTVNSLDTTSRIQLFENGEAIEVWVKVEPIENTPTEDDSSEDTANKDGEGYEPINDWKVVLTSNDKVLDRVLGTMYIKSVAIAEDNNVITLAHITDESKTIIFNFKDDELQAALNKFKIPYELDNSTGKTKVVVDTENEKFGPCYYTSDNSTPAFEEGKPIGPEKVIVQVARLNVKVQVEDQEGPAITAESTEINLSSDTKDFDIKDVIVTLLDANTETKVEYVDPSIISVYGSSISKVILIGGWQFTNNFVLEGGVGANALYTTNLYDRSLTALINKGDQLVGEQTSSENESKAEIVYVQEVGTGKAYIDSAAESVEAKYILLTGKPLLTTTVSTSEAAEAAEFVIRIDGSLNQEIGNMKPIFLNGYTYKNDKPVGTGMAAKVAWQEFILSAITEYKGIRDGLLNKSEIDYRYVIDTFESFPVSGLKKELTYLCAEKQSAFAICNLPSVSSFVKCPYTSFTDSNGVFNPEYIVAGMNKKKASTRAFSLPSETEGASFGAFYTPLKFSDGYIDTIIPSAGLVSNLFIEKYMSRQPYYIVAGPNYGSINASGLVGPDYKYSRDELNILEPYGFNCMVYKPSFGTFINANQTAKQTPLSALSRVNVRELVIYLQDEIEKVLQSYQWEFNNARTRNAILDRANQICALIAANGGIQTYLNVMDESNNTPEIIDNEMAILSTMIEPGFGCGKMVHELTLYRTGQMSSQVIE